MCQNFKVTKGDTLAFGVELDFDENPQDLEEARFTVKENEEDNAIFQKSLGNGIEKAGESGNEVYYRVRVAPEDTEKMREGIYFYDLEIRTNSDVFTVLEGLFIVKSDISN